MKRILTALLGFMLCMFIPATMSAQSGYQVKGTVVDAMGPVIGAAVMEQGTTTGTMTDLDGNFVLTVSGPNAIVEVSCIGYTTQTFTASAMPATITLADDALFLDDVVVIGYGTVKKEDMTGSVVAIKSDEINRGAITSPSQALLGKVSGLSVTPASGTPGEGARIRIRGAASLHASNDPLIVIDGVPVTGDGGAGMGDPLATVNPNDIESFSVLKDASATAIYGSRASNGVIIITTKKGTKGKPQVNYSGSVSVKQNIATLKMMNGDEFRDYYNTWFKDDAIKMNLLGEDSTDWQKEIYRLGILTDHNLSVSGGNKLPFRVSGGVNYDQATLKTGDNLRGNVDLNLSPKFFDNHLSVNANVKGIIQKTNWANGSAIGDALAFDPTKPIKDSEGNWWNWYSNGAPNKNSSVNPLSDLYEYKNFGRSLRSIGNLQLDYKVHGFEDLRFNVNAGYDIATTAGRKYNELDSFLAKKSSLDLANEYTNFNRNLLFEAYADYNHEFEHSNLDLMAGYSWQWNYVQYHDANYYNNADRYDESTLYERKPTNAKEYYLVSFYGRLNYSILSRYLFTFTLRDDATSRFAKANRWGLFPSAAFAWNIANEPFMANLVGSKAVSSLKLRLGWGRTGQQDIGSDYYPYLARYIFSSEVNMRYNMGSGYYTTMTPIEYNPRIKWETTETLNAGLDFGFASDRITGTVEAYKRTTTDLLNDVTTPMGANFSNSVISNVGSMENKGIELSLNFIPVETQDWHWSIGGNVTFQHTEITKLTDNNIEGYIGVPVGSGLGGINGYSSLYRIGCAPYTFYLYEQLYDSEGNPVLNGLVDRDGDNQITDRDRYVTGYSPNPDAFFGLNTRLSYKNWDFSMNGHGSIGNYAINAVAKNYSTSYSADSIKGYLSNLSDGFLVDGWLGEINTNMQYTDMFIENASFFKLDDVNLGYTFHFGKGLVKSLRLAGSVQNVCTITKYSGLDPELTAIDGVDNNIIPRPRLYTFRVNVNF